MANGRKKKKKKGNYFDRQGRFVMEPVKASPPVTRTGQFSRPKPKSPPSRPLGLKRLLPERFRDPISKQGRSILGRRGR